MWKKAVVVGGFVGLVGLVACNITVSGPGETTNNGMPYIGQETGDYCMPASI